MTRPVGNKLLNREELGEWIKRRLGAPMWEIELCEEHITDAVEQAIRWFAAKKGVQKLFTESMVSGQVEYELDCDIDKVIDVIPTQQKLDLSLIFSPFTLLEEKIPYDVFASGGSGGLYSSYVQSLQYIEMAKRILSAEFEWTQIGNKLFLAPIPEDTRTMIIWAKINVTNIEELMERDHLLIKEYALAKAMTDIAWVRGKYASYPSAQGETSLNWDRILDQANQDLERLEEEISNSGFPMGFVTG
jgi:hypothetical protein